MKRFEFTSDKPYDRHNYKLKLKNGKSIILKDYETLRSMWYQYKDFCTDVEIIDINNNKGFA